MKQFAVILLLTLGFSLNSEAQSFLNDLRTNKSGQGTVTISQSKDIDELVNNAKLVKSAPATVRNENTVHNSGTTEQRQPQHQGQERRDTAEEPLREQHYTQGNTSPSAEAPAINTTKKVMTQQQKNNRLPRTGLCRRQLTCRPAESRKHRQCHKDEISRPSGLRPLLFSPLDLPRRQLQNLSGSKQRAEGNQEHGLQAGLHRQRKNNRWVLIFLIRHNRKYVTTARQQ